MGGNRHEGYAPLAMQLDNQDPGLFVEDRGKSRWALGLAVALCGGKKYIPKWANLRSSLTKVTQGMANLRSHQLGLANFILGMIHEGSFSGVLINSHLKEAISDLMLLRQTWPIRHPPN
jgi:hypothetical protein